MSFPPLADVLPHKAPMILLDRIDAELTDGLVCSVTLRADSPFVEDGAVPGVVALEYMAQTVAAFAGLRATRESRTVRVGYLIGARTVAFHVESFRAGDALVVRAERTWGDDALGTFDVTVTAGGRLAAEATLSVYQGDLRDGLSGEMPTGDAP